jgi:hypothetical protein
MEEKNTNFTSILLREHKSDNILDLVEIYKQDKVKARIIYNERKEKLNFNNEFLYSFEYDNKDFRIVSFLERIFFTKKNVMYRRKSSPFIIIYKHKNKSFYLKRGNTFNVMKVGELLQYCSMHGELDRYLIGKFGWIRNLYDADDCRHLTLGTVIKHKLFNREKLIKHVYGANRKIANILSTAKNKHGDIAFIWKQYKHVLINTDSLTETFLVDNLHILRDTLRYADMFGEKVNAKWGKKRLKEEHDRMYRNYIDIILEFEPLRELNIRPIYLEFQKFTGFNMLTTNHQLIEEGKKQHHCVGTYVGQVNSGDCAIFTIDKYTMEIRFDKRGEWDNTLNRFVSQDRKVHLNQLRGYGNKAAPKELEEIVKLAIVDFNKSVDLKHFENLHYGRVEYFEHNHNEDNDLPF